MVRLYNHSWTTRPPAPPTSTRPTSPCWGHFQRQVVIDLGALQSPTAVLPRLLHAAIVLSRGPILIGNVRVDRFLSSRSDHKATIESLDDVPRAVGRLMELLVTDDESISSDTIVLTLQGPTLFNCVLVDLPGFVPDAGERQDTRVRDLVHRHTCQPDTILLAVVPATTTADRVETLDKALEVDPEGKRTVMVVTKLDLVDDLEKHRVLRLVLNETTRFLIGMSAPHACPPPRPDEHGPVMVAALAGLTLGALFAMHTVEQLATPFGWRLYQAAKLGMVLSFVVVALLWLHVLDCSARVAMPSTLFVWPKETGATPTRWGDGWITLPSSCWGELLRYRLLSVHCTLWATKAIASLKAALVEMEAQMGPPLDTPTQRRAVFESLVMKHLRELSVRLHGNPGAHITRCVLQKLTGLAPVMARPVGEHVDGHARTVCVDEGGDQVWLALKNAWLHVPEYAPHEVSRLVSRFPSFPAFCAMSGRWVNAWEAIVDEIVKMFAELTRYSAIVDLREVQGSAGAHAFFRGRTEAVLRECQAQAAARVRAVMAHERSEESLKTKYFPLRRKLYSPPPAAPPSFSRGLLAMVRLNDGLRGYFSAWTMQVADAVMGALRIELGDNFGVRLQLDLLATADADVESVVGESAERSMCRRELQAAIDLTREAFETTV